MFIAMKPMKSNVMAMNLYPLTFISSARVFIAMKNPQMDMKNT